MKIIKTIDDLAGERNGLGLICAVWESAAGSKFVTVETNDPDGCRVMTFREMTKDIEWMLICMGFKIKWEA